MAGNTYMNNCRACLIPKPSFTYFLFENVCPDSYYFCTSVQVSKDEELPRGVCNSCYELLKNYSDFKRTCLQSQAMLLDIVSNKSFKYEVDVQVTHRTENYDLNETLNDNIKVEVIDGVIKSENGDDHVYLSQNDDELCDDEPIVNKVKTQKRNNIKKAVKLKADKNVKKQRKKLIYSCDICQKKFNYKERFDAHKLEHEGKIVSIYCAPCQKSFITWSGLKRHQNSTHTQVNLESLRCNTCGKIFKSQDTLRSHKKIHGTRNLIMCDICGKGFTTTTVLKIHRESHKENRERRFTCEHCGKKFFTKTVLLSHVARRHLGRTFICQICSYPFNDKYNLTKHLLIHEGKKLFKCDICMKSFRAHSTLVEHKRLHTGERPYVCSHCQKTFVSKKRLTDHLRIHTGDKPHKCTLCEQRFTQRGTLKRHMKVHDRPAPTIS